MQLIAIYCGVYNENIVACPVADSSSEGIAGIYLIAGYAGIVDYQNSAVIVYGSSTAVGTIDRVVYKFGV